MDQVLRSGSNCLRVFVFCFIVVLCPYELHIIVAIYRLLDPPPLRAGVDMEMMMLEVLIRLK